MNLSQHHGLQPIQLLKLSFRYQDNLSTAVLWEYNNTYPVAEVKGATSQELIDVLPAAGMTSQTDPAGRTTYYEYDNLARLTVIRDQDQKVVKKIEYKFQSQ